MKMKENEEENKKIGETGKRKLKEHSKNVVFQENEMFLQK